MGSTNHADRDARLAAAQAEYFEVMTHPGPDPTRPYYDAGVLGFVFGEMWPRPELSRRDRRWVTLSCVAAAGAVVPIQTHVFAALNSGDCTLQEVVLHFATYQGWHRGARFDDTVVSAWARVQTEADGS